MAKASGKKKTTGSKRKRSSGKKGRAWLSGPLRKLGRIALRAVIVFVLLLAVLVTIFAFVRPPTTHTIWSENRRLGKVDWVWVSLDDVAPVVARSVVAAEDANFCNHWGFDVAAIRSAIEDGSGRGGSTISQQVVKNVFLWQQRSWFRKALEAVITPAVEAVWSKRRIIEIYLNVAEFDEGVFGIEAAAWHYFKVGPGDLSATQAARLAAVLPAPKSRSAANPSVFVRQRSAAIRDGAATIRADGRAACFED